MTISQTRHEKMRLNGTFIEHFYLAIVFQFYSLTVLIHLEQKQLGKKKEFISAHKYQIIICPLGRAGQGFEQELEHRLWRSQPVALPYWLSHWLMLRKFSYIAQPHLPRNGCHSQWDAPSCIKTTSTGQCELGNPFLLSTGPAKPSA